MNFGGHSAVHNAHQGIDLDICHVQGHPCLVLKSVGISLAINVWGDKEMRPGPTLSDSNSIWPLLFMNNYGAIGS